jgi:hypothetical protein
MFVLLKEFHHLVCSPAQGSTPAPTIWNGDWHFLAFLLFVFQEEVCCITFRDFLGIFFFVFTAERREACVLQELSGVRLRLCALAQRYPHMRLQEARREEEEGV